MLNELTKMKMPYRSKINVYVKRRSNLLKKYGRKSPLYLKHTKALTQKIKIWKLSIERIEQWERKIKEIDSIIVEFLGVSAKNSGRHYKMGDKWMARHFLCRYGKETGIPPKFIKAYINLSAVNAVGISRLRLIRRCAVNDELMNTWKNFKSTINAA